MLRRCARQCGEIPARLALLLLFVSAAAQGDFGGRVVSVLDGDSIVVRAGAQDVHVRLVGIDAPERGQAYGGAAKRSLASRISGREVHVVERGIDAYGRTLGRVFIGNVDVNEVQVRNGYAWVFRRFENDASLLALEDQARTSRRGLWRGTSPIAPWIWRERNRERALPAPAQADPPTSDAMPAP